MKRLTTLKEINAAIQDVQLSVWVRWGGTCAPKRLAAAQAFGQHIEVRHVMSKSFHRIRENDEIYALSDLALTDAAI
jgi:hypothetical protein